MLTFSIHCIQIRNTISEGWQGGLFYSLQASFCNFLFRPYKSQAWVFVTIQIQEINVMPKDHITKCRVQTSPSAHAILAQQQ